LLNIGLLYILYGFIPAELNNSKDVLKTKKNIIMNPFFYSKCNDDSKSYHEIYIQKYQTNRSNQFLQVIICHKCNSQWKEIWATTPSSTATNNIFYHWSMDRTQSNIFSSFLNSCSKIVFDLHHYNRSIV
jgi:hypothetical protein